MREVSDKPRSAGKIVFAVLRIIAALICVFLLYTFLYTISLLQINVGNILGSAFCIAVILLVALYPLLRKKKPLRIAAKICGAGLAAFTLYCAVISGLMISEMLHGSERVAAASTTGGGAPQTVVVLGCMSIDGEPSPMLKMRLDKTLEYMNEHLDAVCVVTGGQGANEIEPEAVTMRRYLNDHGIPDSRIYIEDHSVNTAENIRFAAQIISNEGLSPDAVIVSECYHLFRGVRQAKLTGLNASGIFPDPAPVIKTLPSYWLREILAVSRDLFLA